MSLNSTELLKFLIIIILFLGISHTLGYIFEKLKQPRVIGEILTGILLGNTILKNFFPDVFQYLFEPNSPSIISISGFQELGLIFLMFCSGYEIQWMTEKKDLKASLVLSFVGLIIPMIVAFYIFPFFDFNLMLGSINSIESLNLVFCMAVAVTSIPVISRILMDLNLLGTRFSRIVLTVALIEDLILYGFFSALLTKHNFQYGHHSFIKKVIGLEGDISFNFFYNLVLTILFFILANKFGPSFFRKIKDGRINFLFKGNVIAFIIVYLFSFVILSFILGIAPIFGAFIAGMILVSEKENLKIQMEELKSFAFSTFIPIYFVVVGFKLDLLNGMNWTLLLQFLFFSSVLKIFSVMLGTLFLKIDLSKSLSFGISLNARGGPGIVLATLAFNSGIISNYFFSVLVITAILTSLLAGYYLRLNKKLVLEI